MYYCRIFMFILVFYDVRHDKIRSVHLLTSNDKNSMYYLGRYFSVNSVVSNSNMCSFFNQYYFRAIFVCVLYISVSLFNIIKFLII